MIRTNLDLKKACARLLGADDPAQLGDEAEDVQGYVNQAYRMCYNPADGLFPRWARRTMGVFFGAPVHTTIAVKHGSQVIAGHVFPDDAAGCVVKVGDKCYRYAGRRTGSGTLLVSGAGTAAVNGTYVASSTVSFEGQPVYYLNGDQASYRLFFDGAGYVLANPGSVFPGLMTDFLYYGEADGSATIPWEADMQVYEGESPAPEIAQGSDFLLVEPWADASGTVNATIYSCVAAMPLRVVHVFGRPEIVGRGPLYPLAGAEGEIDARASWPGPDFYTLAGAPSGVFRRPITWTSWEVGEPYFYHVNDTIQPYGFAVYPLPDKAYSVNLRIGILPESMTGDAEVPVLPGDCIEDVLAPIARFLTATQSKRFSGNNIQGLKTAYDTALARLKALASPQIETGGSLRPAANF